LAAFTDFGVEFSRVAPDALIIQVQPTFFIRTTLTITIRASIFILACCAVPAARDTAPIPVELAFRAGQTLAVFCEADPFSFADFAGLGVVAGEAVFTTGETTLRILVVELSWGTAYANIIGIEADVAPFTLSALLLVVAFEAQITTLLALLILIEGFLWARQTFVIFSDSYVFAGAFLASIWIVTV